MKTTGKSLFFFVLLNVVSILCLKAQTATVDTITKITGERIGVKIQSSSDNSLTYSFPGETMTIVISKNIIKEIKYASGRKEILNELVVIEGEKDWSKVKFTSLLSDVEGLVKKGTLEENKNNMGPIYTPAKKTMEKMKEKLQREAAKLGAHIVLLTDNSTDSEFRLVGVAYGYK